MSEAGFAWDSAAGIRSALAFAEQARKAAEPARRALEAHQRSLAPTLRVMEAYQRAMGPTLRLIEAHEREMNRIAGLMRGANRQLTVAGSAAEAARTWQAAYDTVLKHVNVPALKTAGRMWAERSEFVIGHLDFEVPPDLLPAIDEAAQALAESDAALPENTFAHSADDPEAGRFAAALDALITVGLVSRDLTAAAFLMTVQAVQRAWGYKAARRALATFIALTITVAWAAWLVNDAGKAPSEALKDAADLPIAALLVAWCACGGKKLGDD